jgi:hypothetical protein
MRLPAKLDHIYSAEGGEIGRLVRGASLVIAEENIQVRMKKQMHGGRLRLPRLNVFERQAIYCMLPARDTCLWYAGMPILIHPGETTRAMYSKPEQRR